MLGGQDELALTCCHFGQSSEAHELLFAQQVFFLKKLHLLMEMNFLWQLVIELWSPQLLSCYSVRLFLSEDDQMVQGIRYSKDCINSFSNHQPDSQI